MGTVPQEDIDPDPSLGCIDLQIISSVNYFCAPFGLINTDRNALKCCLRS